MMKKIPNKIKRSSIDNGFIKSDMLLYYIKKFESLDKKSLFYIYLGASSLLFFFFYYYFFSPDLRKISELDKKILIAKKQLNESNMTAGRIEYFRKEKKLALKKFDELLEVLPNNNEIPSLLSDISEAGRSLGLEFILFQPEDEIKKEFVIRLPISIQLTGNYFNLIDFLNKLASFSRLVNVENIKIELLQDDSLLINCRASTYRFIDDN